MSSEKKDTKRNVLIIGAGMAGVTLARTLSSSLNPSTHNLILIDPRPFVILLPAALRLVVSDIDNLEEQVLVPFDKVFHNGNGTFIQASATNIDFSSDEKTQGSVTLSTGDVLPYDILVLATGSKWAGPLAFPEAADDVHAFIKQRREEFAEAKDILLVGGGAVGIELAGEIKDVWPDKAVTIIHRESRLLNKTYPDKFRIGMEQQLKARGVTVITGDSIEDLPEVGAKIPESGLVTKEGKVLKPDLVSQTWGIRPATSFLAPYLLSDSGFVKVLPTLQLPSHPNVFAIGDIIDWNEQKQVAKATYGHIPVVTKNILKYIALTEAGKKVDLDKSGAKYKGSFEMILVTNGKTSGMAYLGMLWGFVFGAWFARLLKSKDLMVSKMRAGLGY